MNQETLLQAIRQKIGNTASLIEEIATILEISYDAAHRRTAHKSKLTIDETIQLAKHYGISLDNLFQKEEYVLVNKTKEIKDFQDLSNYLNNSYQSLANYPQDDSTYAYYSAKDIPLFYTLGTDILSQFKRYVWMNMLTQHHDNIAFEQFQFKARLLENAEKLSEFYNNITKHEIWNDTTINSTLQQIMYYYESGLLNAESALQVCDNLMQLIQSLEQNCSNSNRKHNIYYHELLILNNNVLITNNKKNTLFVPYTMLGYFITNDIETCKFAHNFFHHQLQNSKLLNTAGKKDKKMFFNKMYEKINYYKRRIVENYTI